MITNPPGRLGAIEERLSVLEQRYAAYVDIPPPAEPPRDPRAELLDEWRAPRGPITIYPSADDPWSPWPPPKENAMTHLEHLALAADVGYDFHSPWQGDLDDIRRAHNALVDVVNTMNDIVEITGTLEDTLDTTIELSSAGMHALHWVPTSKYLAGIAACDCGWHSGDLPIAAALDFYADHINVETEIPE